MGSSRQVYTGILRELDDQRMVPGQRLIETELAVHYSVGRNAVREAMQHLAARGIVDLSPNRSPSIRTFDREEGFEVLAVADVMTRLVARTAALTYKATDHQNLLVNAAEGIKSALSKGDPRIFNRARRYFYRALLDIGANRELQRLFPAIGMHILHLQYASPKLQQIRHDDYLAIIDAVKGGDAVLAETVAAKHVKNVRIAIEELQEEWSIEPSR